MFLVHTDLPGVTIVRRTPTMMSDMPCEIALDDVKAPAENLIGKEGEGMRQAQSWITAGRLDQPAAASALPAAASSSRSATPSSASPSARRSPTARRCSSCSPTASPSTA